MYGFDTTDDLLMIRYSFDRPNDETLVLEVRAIVQAEAALEIGPNPTSAISRTMRATFTEAAATAEGFGLSRNAISLPTFIDHTQLDGSFLVVFDEPIAAACGLAVEQVGFSGSSDLNPSAYLVDCELGKQMELSIKGVTAEED